MRTSLSFFRTRQAILAGPIALALGWLALADAAQAQTTLAVGDIQVIGATGDAADSFTFVLWKDIAASTVIRFMDQSFTNATTGLIGSEIDMALTFNTALTAGTVVRVVDGGTTLVNGGAFSGTKTGTLSGLSADGDQVFVYQGTAVGSSTSFGARTLLYGFNVADTNWLSSGSASANASYLPTAINSLDANFDSGNFDNVDYTGARTGLTAAVYRAAAANVTNYTQNNTRFDLGTSGFSVNGTASLTWDANGNTAGTGGSGAWDATTTNRFKNGSSGTTYFHWVNSSAGNDHTAVFEGTAGTVSVASGGVTASGLKFDVNGYTIQSNTITLPGTAPKVTVTNASDTAVISSTVSTTGTLTKEGNGKLVISGSLSGAVSVTAGLFGGGGTSSIDAAGATSVSSGATIDPGLNPGTGTGTMNAGDFSLLSGGHIVLQLGGTTAGSQYDQFNVTGTVSLSGDLTGSLINGYQGLPGSGDKLFIIKNNSDDSVSGEFSNTFTLEGKDAVQIGAATFFVSYIGDFDTNGLTGGNDVVLYAVPEPNTWACMLVGVAGLVGWRRFRRVAM